MASSLINGMYKLSFKIRHKGCHEAELSSKYPMYQITVIDIQSVNPKEKHYLYYIMGENSKFDDVIKTIRMSGGYKTIEEVERSENTLLLLVNLNQKSYIQNTIQKHNGFLLGLHIVQGGYEYWHVGAVKKESIKRMLNGLRRLGKLKILYFGEVDFSSAILPEQQRKVVLHAYKKGYYQTPRKTTILEIANEMDLSPATVGEHLLKAENKIFASVLNKL